MRLWRVCRSPYARLDGEGARLYGGRWNSEGIAVVYLSTSLALAALEYLAHLDVSMVPSDLVSVEVLVPDDVSSERVDLAALPLDWSRVPDHEACVELGDTWARKGASCLLFAPSAIVPESWNVLLNPAHPEARRVTAATRSFTYDPRLLA